MPESVTINGVEFTPHPDIGFRLKNDDRPLTYAYPYIKLVHDIDKGVIPQADTFRMLISKDLWFVLYFIVKPFADDAGRAMVNHPFIVQAAQEIERGPKDFTLDIWAREHFKTTFLIAEMIQYQLLNPEHSSAILSYIAPKSKKILRSIRSILEREEILHATFPDVLYANPEKESPLWSIDEGLINKRKSNRQEPSIGAYGLTEGMPTGLHFENREYDDITTEDIAESYGIMESIKLKFDSSQNIGKEGGRHRVRGTYYNHMDPLIYIRDKKRIDKDGNETPAYHLRFKPATDDGTANGRPVLISQQRLDDLKLTKSFRCQQLCDPTPATEMRLDPAFLAPIERQFVPKNLYRIMIIDQAGDLDSKKDRSKDSDSWAMVVLGVNPEIDEIGQSEVTILDLWISPATEAEAIDQAIRMFLAGGIVQKLGVEVTSQTKDHLHIGDALFKRGRKITWGEANQHTNGVRLRPAGRNKGKFIESALSWPLNNSKWLYCKDIPKQYIDRLKQEMDRFPAWHDDGLNACAYLYDILPHCRFQIRAEEKPKDKPVSQIMAEQVLLTKWG